MAVRHGAHLEFFAQPHCFAVVALGRLGIGRLALGRDLPEKAQALRLAAALTALPGESQRSFRIGERAVEPPSPFQGFAPQEEIQRMVEKQAPASMAGTLSSSKASPSAIRPD